MTENASIWVVGMGSGNLRFLTRQAMAVIRASELLIGSSRLLSVLEEDNLHTRLPADSPEAVRKALEQAECSRIAVLIPWDTSQGYGSEVCRAIGEYDLQIVPGITEQAYLCARTGADCGDAVMFYPGNDRRTLAMMLRRHEAVVVNGGLGMEKSIRGLIRLGGEKTLVYMVEHPGSSSEKALRGTAENFRNKRFEEDSLFLFRRPEGGNLLPPRPPEGAGDQQRESLPEEARVLAVHAMGIRNRDVVYDIGCGDGWITLAAAEKAPDGAVYGIESNVESADAAEKNRCAAGYGNVAVIAGAAPGALAHLPKPDVAVIQGTGRTLKEILQILVSRNPSVRVVCVRRTVEGASEAVRLMEGMHFSPSMTELGFVKTRKLEGRNRLEPQYPCFLVCGTHRVKDSVHNLPEGR